MSQILYFEFSAIYFATKLHITTIMHHTNRYNKQGDTNFRWEIKRKKTMREFRDVDGARIKE